MPNRGGEYTFTAVYNGDAWYNGATATCTVTVVTKATPVEPVAVGYLVEYYLEGRWGYELEDTEFFTGKIETPSPPSQGTILDIATMRGSPPPAVH